MKVNKVINKKGKFNISLSEVSLKQLNDIFSCLTKDEDYKWNVEGKNE